MLSLGIGYLAGPNVIKKLHETAIDPAIKPKLWIDDVFTTGIVTKAANITLIDNHNYFKCCGNKGRAIYQQNWVIGEVGKGDALIKAWLNNTSPLTTISSLQSDSSKPEAVTGEIRLTDSVVTSAPLFNFDKELRLERDSRLIHLSVFLLFAVIVLIVVLIRRKRKSMASGIVYRKM